MPPDTLIGVLVGLALGYVPIKLLERYDAPHGLAFVAGMAAMFAAVQLEKVFP